jgi:beta-glucosidase
MALTSAELDGVSPRADWSYWIQSGRAPTSVDRGLDVARWSDDLGSVADLGASEVVLTGEWSRLEPEAGGHDPIAVALLRNIIDEANRAGLSVWLCLVDGTLPGWFTYDEHGFGDRRSRERIWPRHVEWMGETFGDLVCGWIPIREPGHLGVRSRYLDLAPPGGTNPVKGAEAVRDLALAEAEAWRILRGSQPVATWQTARIFVPDGPNVKASAHARDWDRLLLRPWLESLVDGTISVGDLPTRPVPVLQDAFDQVFVQLRPPILLDGTGTWSPHPSARAIELLVAGLARVRDHLGERPVLGVADLAPYGGGTEGGADYLAELIRGAAEVGVDGWFQSSPIDGWHWEGGEQLTPGIIDRSRRPKPAAAAFQFRER